MMQIPGLYIAPSEGRGKGVFTAGGLDKGDLIEICPLLIVPPKQLAAIHQTFLHDYYFLWPEPKGSAAIALGFGSIYNHQSPPNAKVHFDLSNQTIEMHCISDISAGGEIFIDYNDGDEKNDGLWFNPR